MKNLGSIALLLAAAATQVATLPTVEGSYPQIRAINDAEPHVWARVPKKNKNNGAGKT